MVAAAPAAPKVGPKTGEAEASIPAPTPKKPRQPAPQSGRLTAGSFDDNLLINPFRAFVRKMSQSSNVPDLPGRLTGQRLIVHVKGPDGNPVGNARVRIASAQGQAAVDLVTRSDGRVIVLSSWDNLPRDGDLTVTVTPPDGSDPVRQTVAPGADRCDVRLAAVAAPLPRNLDLVLLLDATSSMADEMKYLKSEIRSITASVRDKFPHVQQRYSLIVYRDQGDEYVVRSFDFTDSVEVLHKHLAAQRADGGGDLPEAMHRGLEEAVKLQWRNADTARVLFLVADAPPHAHEVGKAMQAADALRKRGVAIYPVACSGYDDATELVMRTCALLTGGQFLFLTDDSGVGNAHGEPHLPGYHVQRLDRLMIRAIADELAGRRIEPTRDEILRTVGNPPRPAN